MRIPAGAAPRRTLAIDEVLPSVDLRPFVGGVHTDVEAVAMLDITDPGTGRAIARLPAAQHADVHRAVGAARQAFDEGPWPRMTPTERGACLIRLAGLIERDQAELALLESLDTGKLFAGVQSWDIGTAAQTYRYYAELASHAVDQALPTLDGVQVTLRREPVGVCAVIVAWNFPFACAAWKLAPALAAGCTVVVKAPERAPLSLHALAARIAEAGFPPGVVNIITGIGQVAGTALVSDPRIDMISFTGSTATARAITRASAWRIPPIVTELGGKGANAVFPDADLDRALAAAVDGAFGVAGQNCCAVSRLLVHRDIYDDFVSSLTDHAQRRRLGDQFDDATEQGPQIDETHLEAIDSMVQDALADGAHAETGAALGLPGPLHYQPTVLTNVSPQAKISHDEVFGPVVCIYPFHNLDEAITIANNSIYGLSASVWTTSTSIADRFTDSVRVGTVWVNCFGYFMPHIPWGGVKLSGNGRELGPAGISEYLVTKTVCRAL
ncbi:aldehyde dehydrogenase [Nocardia beijingensis]|uniref:aldehyde dehydrogenase family protein n=1 Tax=Nocardia beijingensis TaxID=95162 RepID=UPI0018941D65|nr:aldehyde dehydrogenase family protein [Nocardia beijingensis]MBF6469773.1 aldehyde dehydrogenase [Nocardia beijingensis]